MAAAVTLDAEGCQAAIAHQLVDQEADRVLAVKGIREKLLDRVVRAFADAGIGDGRRPPCRVGYR